MVLCITAILATGVLMRPASYIEYLHNNTVLQTDKTNTKISSVKMH